MLFDDLQEQLKAISPDIDTIIAYWNNAELESRYQELDAQTKQESFWQTKKIRQRFLKNSKE